MESSNLSLSLGVFQCVGVSARYLPDCIIAALYLNGGGLFADEACRVAAQAKTPLGLCDCLWTALIYWKGLECHCCGISDDAAI